MTGKRRGDSVCCHCLFYVRPIVFDSIRSWFCGLVEEIVLPFDPSLRHVSQIKKCPNYKVPSSITFFVVNNINCQIIGKTKLLKTNIHIYNLTNCNTYTLFTYNIYYLTSDHTLVFLIWHSQTLTAQPHIFSWNRRLVCGWLILYIQIN